MKIIAVACLFLSLISAFLCGYMFESFDNKKGNQTPNLVPQAFSEKPDFAAYTDIKQKKSDFFLFLLPKIQLANAKIIKERNSLKDMLDQLDNLTNKQSDNLAQLAKKYKVKARLPLKIIEELLNRVDTIPASLVLAQAANESAWATSRFAVQGNNLFGQWCYVKDCGLVPKQRGKGQHHEVAQFKSIQQSIESYMRNLNSQYSYEELRQMRQQLRRKENIVSGHQLAQGLLKYSTRREAYVEEIQTMIRQNGLSQYD